MSIYIPILFFLGVSIVLLVSMILSLRLSGNAGIISSLLSTFISFFNSKIIVNGQVIQNIGGLDGSGNVVQGVTVIQIPALSYLFVFVGVIMTGMTIYHIYKEFEYKRESGYTEMDF